MLVIIKILVRIYVTIENMMKIPNSNTYRKQGEVKRKRFKKRCVTHSSNIQQEVAVILKKIASGIEEIANTTNLVPGKPPLYPRHKSGVNL